MASDYGIKRNPDEMGHNRIADMVRAAFCAWLSGQQGRQHDTNTVIASLDIVSEQLLIGSWFNRFFRARKNIIVFGMVLAEWSQLLQ